MAPLDFAHITVFLAPRKMLCVVTEPHCSLAADTEAARYVFEETITVGTTHDTEPMAQPKSHGRSPLATKTKQKIIAPCYKTTKVEKKFLRKSDRRRHDAKPTAAADKSASDNNKPKIGIPCTKAPK